MQLTKHTDYAFRTLMFLAANPNKQATILEISERFNIPKSHLMKVVSKLVAHKYIKSSRGRYGGIMLANQPQDINLKDVVVLMEQTLMAIDCDGLNCIIKDVCRLRGVLGGAQNAYLNYLSKMTLADVMSKPTIDLLTIRM